MVTISRLILILAVMLMPLGMGQASAGPVHHQAMADMPMGHCSDSAPSHGAKVPPPECAMACSAALPAADVSREQHLALERTKNPSAPVQRLRGLHPEIATPPPRTA